MTSRNNGNLPVDTDLDTKSREELIAELVRLRNAVRAHRDSTGHELCWHHPDLWKLLPEQPSVKPVVPEWPVFLRGCLKYRQSLDEQLPDAPRSKQEFSGEADHDDKKTVRAFVAAINSKDWSALRQLVAPAFKRHSVAAGSPGVNSFDDLVRFLNQEYETFPDASEWIEDIIAEGSKVAVRHRFRGTQTGPMGSHPPSGRVLDATYLAIYRLESGVIAEAWAEWDNLAGLNQLGHDDAT